MRAIGPCSWLSAAACAHTRNGHNWSDRYPGIIAAARKLSCRSAILDGEVIVQDARGVSDFEALHVALRSRPSRLIFYAFDLLHLDGKDLFDRPWSNAGRNSWNWSGTTRKVQFSSAKISLAMLPHSFAPVPHMSLRGEAREDFEARLGKLKQVSFGWRVLCTAKTLGFPF